MNKGIFDNAVYIPYGHAILRCAYAKGIDKYVMMMIYSKDYHTPGQEINEEVDTSFIPCTLMFDSAEHVKAYADALQKTYESIKKSENKSE